MPSNMTFIKKCLFCGKQHVFTVPTEKFNRWQGGEYIQDVFPELDANIRETMISGSCSECFDAAFKEPE